MTVYYEVAVDEFLTTEELAAILKVGPYTIKRLRKDGIGPTVIRIAGRARYRRADIAAWAEALSKASTERTKVALAFQADESEP